MPVELLVDRDAGFYRDPWLGTRAVQLVKEAHVLGTQGRTPEAEVLPLLPSLVSPTAS
jgi:hypothetical protein